MLKMFKPNTEQAPIPAEMKLMYGKWYEMVKEYNLPALQAVLLYQQERIAELERRVSELEHGAGS
jgi:hypothetical protein